MLFIVLSVFVGIVVGIVLLALYLLVRDLLSDEDTPHLLEMQMVLIMMIGPSAFGIVGVSSVQPEQKANVDQTLTAICGFFGGVILSMLVIAGALIFIRSKMPALSKKLISLGFRFGILGLVIFASGCLGTLLIRRYLGVIEIRNWVQDLNPGFASVASVIVGFIGGAIISFGLIDHAWNFVDAKIPALSKNLKSSESRFSLGVAGVVIFLAGCLGSFLSHHYFGGR